MHDSVFRKYDIRGTVGSEFQLDQVYPLTRAIACYMLRNAPDMKTVALGWDGRSSSPEVVEEITRALQDSGLNVMQLGLCHSPALYFALHTLPVDAGLMVTASHNPPEDNGIKICLGTHSVWGDEIERIKALYQQGETATRPGNPEITTHDIVTDYVSWCADHFKPLHNTDVSAVIDCGNGATSVVVPPLIERMGLKGIKLLCTDVGEPAEHEADPVIEKNMFHVRDALNSSDLQFGMGFDGDGDRMAPMTKSGKLVMGDVLLALFARPLLQEHPGAVIVSDVKASSGLAELISEWGGRLVFSAVGHAIVKAKMREVGSLLGGELSCHFIFSDRYFGYDDGVYAALRLIELLQQSNATLDELVALFPQRYSSPELRLPCRGDMQQTIETIREKISTHPQVELTLLDGVRAAYPDGWVIVRASNTEPVLSVRFESDTPEGYCRLRDKFQILLAPYADVSSFQSLKVPG